MRRVFRVATTAVRSPRLYKTAATSLPRIAVGTAAFAATVSFALTASEPSKTATVTEPYSKVAFPEQINGLQLLGVGLRSKYSMFSVYAYGIWVDPALTASLVSTTDEKFFKALIADRVHTKRITLAFVRDITGDDLRTALEASIAPRCKDSAKKEVADFFSQFAGLALRSGTELTFSLLYGDDGKCRIETEFQGNSIGNVAGESVGPALLDVYLGDSPVSSDLKPCISARRKKNFL